MGASRSIRLNPGDTSPLLHRHPAALPDYCTVTLNSFQGLSPVTSKNKTLKQVQGDGVVGFKVTGW